MRAVVFCFITVFSLSSAGFPEGTIVLLQTFNENLNVQQIPVPSTPDVDGRIQKNYPLSGDLAQFSLTCPASTCEGPTVLSIDRGPLILHVVLNDRTLSLVETDATGSGDSKPSQVVELDSQCAPLRLMPFRYSIDQFVIVCAGLNIQFAQITSDHRIKLEPLIVGSGAPGVIVESNRQLFSISYLGQNGYEKYSYHSSSPEVLELPANVHCEEGYSATYPLHGQDKFLLLCTTHDGSTLYIVPLDTEVNARGVQSQGRPYSSPNGTYISMVNGTRVVSFPTANQSVLPSVDNFPSQVKKFEFLNSRNALVLTEDGGHYVLELSYGTSRKVKLPGGLPVEWVWISPYDYYLYVTEQNELFLFNETLKDPEEMPKSVVSQPELLLFIEKYKPDNVFPSTNISGLSDEDTSGEKSLPAILGGVFGGTILTAVVALVGGLILVLRYRRKKHPHRKLSGLPIEETSTQHISVKVSGEKNKGEQYEISFSQPVDDQHEVNNTSSSTTNVATASDNPQQLQKKGEVTERDIANFLPVTNTEQVMCPAEVPKVCIEPGKASNSAAKQLLSAITNNAFSPPPMGHGPNDYYAFRENPSCARNTNTATSAFTHGEEETTLLHSDMLAK